jgi:predicted AAA+ superfamily ATPase
VIFDEVQRVPSLFSYIQTLVDDSQIMGQILYCRGRRTFTDGKYYQSLGRKGGTVQLFPFDFNELATDGLLNNDYLQNMIRGFYPAIYDRDIPSKIFYSN